MGAENPRMATAAHSDGENEFEYRNKLIKSADLQRIIEVFLLKCSDVMTNECQVFQKSKLLGERIFNDCV